MHPDCKHQDWKVLFLANISSPFPVMHSDLSPPTKETACWAAQCGHRHCLHWDLRPILAWVIWWLGCRMSEGKGEVAQFPACIFLLHIYFYILPPARNAHFLFFFFPFSHLFILSHFEGQAQLKPELWGLPRAWQWFSCMHVFLHIFWNTHQSLTAYCIFHMRTSSCFFQGTAVFGRSVVRKLCAREAYRREGVLNRCFLDLGF